MFKVMFCLPWEVNVTFFFCFVGPIDLCATVYKALLSEKVKMNSLLQSLKKTCLIETAFRVLKTLLLYFSEDATNAALFARQREVNAGAPVANG